MARKRKIASRKTYIRAFFRQAAENEVDTIDRFRAHVGYAAATERQSIRQRADDLPVDVQEMLADDLYELDLITNLADHLAVVAPYRVVEINTQRMLNQKFGTTAARGKAFQWRTLRNFLSGDGIEIDKIPHYHAINELRLLNNAVKHAGRVSSELARDYPRWKVGNELTDLGAAYERFKGHVPPYILRLAERLKLRFR